MAAARAVRARGITKYFDDVVALDAVDLDVPEAQVHGLVGPNGAGKTTLLGLMLGLTVADRGDLEILGRATGPVRAVHEGVAGFVDGPGLYPTLTARQNLAAVAALRGRDRRDRAIAETLDEVGLSAVTDDRVAGFSLGMRQRLGLAAALLTEPRLLVLDEPANGLDPSGTRHMHEVITRLAGRGTAVVLSSHRMDDLAALCSEVTILATGRVVFTGSVEKLAAETDALDYRIVTSDQSAAARVASTVDGLHLVPGSPDRPGDAHALRIRGPVDAVDELVAALVADRIAVRELGPVMSPLEAAFLALTGGDATDPEEEVR